MSLIRLHHSPFIIPCAIFLSREWREAQGDNPWFEEGAGRTDFIVDSNDWLPENAKSFVADAFKELSHYRYAYDKGIWSSF